MIEIRKIIFRDLEGKNSLAAILCVVEVIVLYKITFQLHPNL